MADVVVPQPHPAAIDLAKNLDAYHLQGFGGIDPNVQVAIAQNKTTPAITNGILTTIRDAASKSTAAVSHALSDPSLKTNPTTGDRLRWHFYNTGIPAKTQPDLVQTQKQMIANKTAPANAQANGIWDSDWTQALYKKAMADITLPGIGSIHSPLKTTLDVLGGGLPSHALPLILDNMKATLHGAVKVLADISQAGVDIATGQEFGINSKPNEPSLGDKVASAILSIDKVYNHPNPEEYLKSYQGMKDFTDGAGTVLTLWSYASLAGGLAKAGAMATGKGALTLLPKEAVAPRFTILNSIMPKVAEGGRRFVFTNAMKNMPVLDALYAPVSKIATGLGDAWQSIRMAAATPYRLPIVGAIGKAGAEVMNAGLKQAAIGKIESGVGDPTGPQAQVLDHLKPVAGVLGKTMDLLSIGLHAPHYDLNGSKKAEVGKIVEGARQKLVNGLDQNSMIADWERGTGTNFTKLAEEATKRDIPVDAIRTSILDDANRYAAQYQARHEVEVLPNYAMMSDNDIQAFVQSRAHQIRNNPELMDAAYKSYTLHPGQFAADLARGMVKLKEDPKFNYYNSYLDKIKADEVMRNSIVPHIKELVTPAKLKSLTGQNLSDAELAASIGRARLDTQTSANAASKINELGSQYAKINPDFKLEDINSMQPGEIVKSKKNFLLEGTSKNELAIRAKAFDYLLNELGVNIKDMRYYTTEDLLSQIKAESFRLPYGDIVVPDGAPTALVEGERVLRNDGWKLVYGTDLGHAFSEPRVNLDELGAAQSKVSRVLDSLGINFAKVEPSVSASQANSAMLNTVQDALMDMTKFPYGSVPAWMTASRGIEYLRNTVQPQLAKGLSTGFNLANSRWLAPFKESRWKKEISSYMEHNPGTTKEDAISYIKQEVAQNSDPRFWTKKQVVEALTKTDITARGGVEVEGASMTKEAAVRFYDAMQKGFRSTPAYIDGFNPINKMLDSTFGIGGKTMPITGMRIPNITGSLKKELMIYRYQGSLRFSYMRTLKSAIKGLTESIPFSMNAEESMRVAGTYEQDMKIRAMYLPHDNAMEQLSDLVSQEYAKNDIWNVYNPRAIEARILGFLHRDALASVGGDISKVDKEKVLKTFDDIYSYGNRTAAEKSVNAIFFPFSFEKTVMRQVGGALLDHSGTRLMVAAALAAYDSADGHKIKDWMEKNVPLVKELEGFNPYKHGITVGTLGGINRLYYDAARQEFINFISPKAITSVDGLKAMMAAIPMLRDLNDIIVGVDTTGNKPSTPGGELGATIGTARFEFNGLMNSLKRDFNGPDKEKYQPHGLLSYDTQQQNGWDFRTKLLTQYAPYLKDNKGKAIWSFDKDIPVVGGQSITSQNINFLVNHVYPKWNPVMGFEITGKQMAENAKERYLIQSKHPNLLDSYDQFVKDAKTISTRVGKGSYDNNPEILAADTMVMRQSAIDLSEKDKTFYYFYKQYYQSKFGPLERIQ